MTALSIHRWRLGLVPMALTLAVATVGHAVDDISFSVDNVEGAGWDASGIVVRLQLPGSSAGASASVDRLGLGSQPQTLRNVRIDCPAVEISSTKIGCRAARITGNVAAIGPQALIGRVVFTRASGDLEVELNGLRIGAGVLRVSGAMRKSGWQVRAQAERVGLEALIKLARQWQLPLPQLAASGLATFTLTASGKDASLETARIAAKLTELTVSNAEGSLAVEKLSLDLQATLARAAAQPADRRSRNPQRDPRDWNFSAAIQSAAGQAYAQPVFLDLGAHALALQAQGRWAADGTLRVDHFTMDHRDVAQGAGSATVDFDAEQPLRALRLDLRSLRFPGAYASYFQPLLLDTSFKSLSTAGVIKGAIDVENGEPQRVDLNFAAVTMDDGVGSLVLNDLDGDWHWRSGAPDGSAEDESSREVSKAPDSMLSFRAGTLFKLGLGATQLRFNSQGRDFRLLQAARIPLLDGAIELESFRIRNAGLPSVAFLVDATLQPVSVQQLCRAFGWPEFGGRIGGVISKLRMREGVVTLGTKLQAQVFDGDVAINDLRLEQPFGQWPRFHANVLLDNLDLELVTGAFSFGLITGRLSGSIAGLELFNWTPVAFDARLRTPPNDRSRHRISQRAVENIGSIGGGGAGVTAALSGGFLRFFENFNYDQLGLSCRLRNDVCVMDGVAAAPNGGYYLVKGKGIPRIDVIGGAHRVDWPRLVQQMIAVTESQGPVVK